MKVRTLIKILLIIAGGLCVLSTIMQWPELELYVKPATVPLFFMLYWFNVKKLDNLFLIILFLCFLGDIFLLTKIENSFIYVLISYTLCYFILFYYLYKNHKPIDYNNSDIIYLGVFFVIWTVVVYEIYAATTPSMGDVKPYGIAYIIILYLLLIGVVFQYINVRSTKSLWLLLAVINFVISDTSFALDKFYFSILELKVINSIYQLLAVFFLVRFKIASSTSLRLKES
ncbi:lysoplasmalogenase family protein [Aquimarina sp. 2201CG5-10]|uniref:lysoplasmalogenase family protein n=1 Tax=Aquimarina callyspongiae TaxID=3098150 RepID=UPI002AB4E1BE|nr:lysoplasmalogenase family protein [Aquimarina sp. 2201CG5-10]MDY8138275.1 lysoplasmalogenase family protein [Aquimarina sp. 2201CG5-10]